QFELVPRNTDVPHFIKWGWSRFLGSTDAAALDPEAQAVANLRTWIAERWDSTIHPTTRTTNAITGSEQKPVRDALGWYDDDAVYLPAHRLREAAGGALKEVEIAKALDAGGFIAKTKGPDRYLIGYIPKVGKVKAYALSRSSVQG